MTRLEYDLEAIGFPFEGVLSSQIKTRLNKTGWISYGIENTSEVRYGVVVYLSDILNFRYVQWFS